MLIPLVSICHRCPFSESNQGGCGGACACTADPQERDINVLAGQKECPHNLFVDPEHVVYPPPPTVKRCRVNVVAGVVGLAKVAMRLEIAPKDLQEKRRGICDACAPGAMLCPECKCIIAAKVRLEKARCPVGKW